MIHLFIGALAMAVLWLLAELARRKEIQLKWWGWLLTAMCIIYSTLVLEMIVGFIGEGAFQAALMLGLFTGFFAVIWGVLLGRFVFKSEEGTSSFSEQGATE